MRTQAKKELLRASASRCPLAPPTKARHDVGWPVNDAPGDIGVVSVGHHGNFERHQVVTIDPCHKTNAMHQSVHADVPSFVVGKSHGLAPWRQGFSGDDAPLPAPKNTDGNV